MPSIQPRASRRALALCLLLVACGDPREPVSLRSAPAGLASSIAATPEDPALDLTVAGGARPRLAEEQVAAATCVERGSTGWSSEGVRRILDDAVAERTGVLVRLPEGASPDALARLAHRVEPVGFGTRLWQVELPAGGDLGALASSIVSAGEAVGVDSVVRSLDTRPNDPLLPYQWSLVSPFGIRALRGWDAATDGSRVVVAVLDTGVDGTSAELFPNLVRGYDAVTNRASQFDPVGHGTSCAGLIGAAGNNGLGVAGVCWKARIMPVRVLDSSGAGTIANIVRGIMYAVQNGAWVINMSLGGPAPSQFFLDALAAARRAGVLVVAAAGNEGANSDFQPSYPAAYPLDNIISVAATDEIGNLASFSNYGLQSVDLAAPGQRMLVLKPGSRAAYEDGTSFAAPLVTGAAALVWSQTPGMSYREVRSQLLRSVDPRAFLIGRVATGGVLNLAKALQAGSRPPAQVVEAESPQTTRSGTWLATVREEHSGRQSLYASEAGATLEATVSGTQVTLLVSTGPNRGVGRVFLDGQLLGTLDLYAASTGFQVEVSAATGLAPGPHTIRVEALGTRNASSSGAFFVVDAFRGR